MLMNIYASIHLWGILCLRPKYYGTSIEKTMKPTMHHCHSFSTWLKRSWFIILMHFLFLLHTSQWLQALVCCVHSMKKNLYVEVLLIPQCGISVCVRMCVCVGAWLPSPLTLTEDEDVIYWPVYGWHYIYINGRWKSPACTQIAHAKLWTLHNTQTHTSIIYMKRTFSAARYNAYNHICPHC